MPNSSFRKALPMIVALIPFLFLTIAAPFQEPLQSILELGYLGIIVGITVWEAVRPGANTDEVQLAAARFSASTGAYAGIVCTVGFLIVMTRVPAVAGFIVSLAEAPGNSLPPAAAGFGLGAMASILCMFVCGLVAYAGWFWRTTQR